jgi:hypothetical protein
VFRILIGAAAAAWGILLAYLDVLPPEKPAHRRSPAEQSRPR